MTSNQVAVAPSAPRGSGVASARTELAVTGMTCSGCVRSVIDALQRVPGVDLANVQLEAGHASVRWKSGIAPNPPALLKAVADAGFDARLANAATTDATTTPADSARRWRLNALLGIIPTVVLMLGEWVFHWNHSPAMRWVSFALASIVQFGPGLHFYLGAWRQLKKGRSNMDTLVALGSTTAFVYSVWALFTGASGHLYFMEAAAIISLVSLGHWLEARVSERASGAVRDLMHLAPPRARRLASGLESTVPVAALELDDIVALRPGDAVPTDGEVIDGDSTVDESMLTGEPMPVEKAPGDTLYAGTINKHGRLYMRVTATGEATALAHIIAAVQRAQTSRADIQRLGDRVSNVFVPVVVLIALATALWWGLAYDHAVRVTEGLRPFLFQVRPPATPLAAAVVSAAAVLIIACPCAMGLATPAAIMAACNAAARRGILIRDGVALEKAGHVTTVVFDKTGTLTVGQPKAGRFTEFADGFSLRPGDLQRLAASLGAYSQHPLSQAVADLTSEDMPLTDWKEHRGAGVSAQWQDAEGRTRLARLGAPKWLREMGVVLNPGEPLIELWSNQGATVLGVTLDTTLVGLVAMKDALKPSAENVAQHLREQGLKLCLMTGDHPRTAVSIAAQARIAKEDVFAEVRPEQKAALVSELQARGEKVAFVGDGLNDAPALEQSDLGIAVARATDVARESADMILLNSELDAVPESLGLARATLRTIKQNLFWAFFYNAIGIPLAALGFMSPVLCAAAMGVSDLVVIGNALRLLHWHPPGVKKEK